MKLVLFYKELDGLQWIRGLAEYRLKEAWRAAPFVSDVEP